MSKKILIIACFVVCFCSSLYSQNRITGRVVNANKEPLEGVAIMPSGLAVTLSNMKGEFVIELDQDSVSVWVLFSSSDGFKDRNVKLYNGEENVNIILQDNSIAMSEVYVKVPKYGKFTNYSAQTTTLDKLEIVTNPSAMGDIIAGVVLNPGVQTNENDGRLILQGGATDESQIYVDGLILFNPYQMRANNSSARSRFSPDLFSGVSLYSGGYAAQYGNALSGVLQLNSNSIDDMISKVDINISSVGVDATIITKRDNIAYRGNVAYMNLTPYGKIVKDDDYQWHKYFNQIATDHFVNAKLGEKGELKSYVNYSNSSLNYSYYNIDSTKYNNDFAEHNFIASVIANFKLTRKWELHLGTNFAYNSFLGTGVSSPSDNIEDVVINSHSKLAFLFRSGKIRNSIGVENIHTTFDENYFQGRNYNLKYSDNLIAVFDEFTLLINKFNLSLGVRGEYSTYLKKFNFAPRAYFSYRFNSNHILSLSAGQYFQMPSNNYLKYSEDLKFRQSLSSTLTYSYVKKSSKVQIDLYYKKYEDLTTFDDVNFYPTDISNNGYGNVKGASIFWRNNIRNFEYWLTYSYTDGDIISGNMEHRAMPSYLSKNRLSVTTKYWISSLRSQIGASFFIDSGATFYDEFSMTSSTVKSPVRNSLDLSWSYLPAKGVIIHLGCKNLLGRKNVYGYEYSDRGNLVMPVTNLGKQFYFIGVFITLSKSNINQLNSL